MKQLLFLITFLICFIAKANNFSFQNSFKNFNQTNGLTSNETYFIYEDKNHFIWICTDKGVLRYDGYNFQKFTKKDGLLDNVVFSVFEDKKGRIWFISYNNLLCYYQDGKIYPYKFNNIIKKQTQNFICHNKNLILDGEDNLYYILYSFCSIKIDHHGKYNFLNYKKNSFKISEINNNPFILSPKYSNNFIFKNPYIFHKNKKVIFTAGYSNIRYTKKGDKTLAIFGNKIISLTDLKEFSHDGENDFISIYQYRNEVWLGTKKKGIIKYKLDKNQLKKQITLLNNFSVTSMIYDHNGGIWFSTLENGIYYSPSVSVFNSKTLKNKLSNKCYSINGIGNFVFAGFNTKAILISPFLSTIIENENYYNCKIASDKKNLYIGGDLKTKEIILNNAPLKIYNTTFFSDYSYFDNYVYLSETFLKKVSNSHKDVRFYNKKSNSKKEKKIPYSFSTIAVEKDTIWLGNIQGLYFLNKNSIKSMPPHEKLFQSDIRDIEINKKNNVKIAATNGNGILFWKKTKLIKQLTTKNKICSDNIYSLHFDQKNRLWCGTDKGISIFKNFIHIKNITIKNGLNSGEINGIYTYNDTAWIATNKGVSKICISKLLDQKIDNKISLVSLKTNQNQYINNIPNEFSHKTSFVQIHFRNHNFLVSSRPTYYYKISKNDKWHIKHSPEILINGIAPGNYEVFVKYLQEDLTISKPFLIAKFIIEKPFYERWYFYLTISIISIALMFFIFKYQINQIKDKNNLNKKIKQLENKALRAQMNPHFIFNALNSIQSFLVYEENEKAEKFLQKFAVLIRMTLNYSRNSMIKIQNEIDLITRYLELEQMRFKEKFDFEITHTLTPNELDLLIPPMLIQPYIENAIIHAFKNMKSKGKILISIEKLEEKKGILCSISDNGIGVYHSSKSNKEHISLGTTITNERLSFYGKIHKDNFQVYMNEIDENSEFPGTIIKVEIPIFDNYEEN